jgi:D-alanine-D-alanine ligase
MSGGKSGFGKVGVLLGGWSSERDVSLNSGAAVLQALQSRGIDAHGVDVGRDICSVLQQSGFDRVFNILHGSGGEDGVIQGLLTVLGIPFTGSDVKASALAMDKLLSKRIWSSAGLATPAYLRLTAETDWQTVVDTLGLPLMVKPIGEGSSVGMSRVDALDQLEQAWRKASDFGEVFAEQWVTGEEYTVAILNDSALPAIRLQTTHKFYDYAAKYEVDDTQYHCPCGLGDAEEEALGKLALAAFRTLGASGWGRVDVMRDNNGKNWLIELNTVPGMTSHSLVPKAAQVAGMDFETLVVRVLETSGQTVA